MPHFNRQFSKNLGFFLAMTVVSALLAGCSATEQAITSSQDPRGNGVWNDPTRFTKKSDDASSLEAVKKASQNQAQRLNDALARGPQIKEPPRIQAAKVRWLNTGGPSISSGLAAISTADQADQTPVHHKPQTHLGSASESFAEQWSQTKQPLNRKRLLARLRDEIRSGNDADLDKAITAIGLSLFDSDRKLNERDLDSLDPNRRASVRRYHQVIVALAEQLASRNGQMDLDAVVEQLDEAFQDRPIRIKKMDLCQRVRGYGVYEPFESRVFLSGRAQAMIIYVELRNFGYEKTPDGRYQVKLSQEVVLYNESDGLAVWRQPAVEIVDESRNRRHDFFVVQMIRIPARLTVGKYLLKVRITDNGNGSLDESTIPIQIVADQTMVAGHGR